MELEKTISEIKTRADRILRFSDKSFKSLFDLYQQYVQEVEETVRQVEDSYFQNPNHKLLSDHLSLLSTYGTLLQSSKDAESFKSILHVRQLISTIKVDLLNLRNKYEAQLNSSAASRNNAFREEMIASIQHHLDRLDEVNTSLNDVIKKTESGDEITNHLPNVTQYINTCVCEIQDMEKRVLKRLSLIRKELVSSLEKSEKILVFLQYQDILSQQIHHIIQIQDAILEEMQRTSEDSSGRMSHEADGYSAIFPAILKLTIKHFEKVKDELKMAIESILEIFQKIRSLHLNSKEELGEFDTIAEYYGNTLDVIMQEVESLRIVIGEEKEGCDTLFSFREFQGFMQEVRSDFPDLAHHGSQNLWDYLLQQGKLNTREIDLFCERLSEVSDHLEHMEAHLYSLRHNSEDAQKALRMQESVLKELLELLKPHRIQHQILDPPLDLLQETLTFLLEFSRTQLGEVPVEYSQENKALIESIKGIYTMSQERLDHDLALGNLGDQEDKGRMGEDSSSVELF